MTDEERQHLQEAWCKCYDAMKDAFEKIAEQMKPVFDAIGKAADLIEAQKKFEFEMTPEEAIEELQNVLNGEIAEYGEEGCEYTEKAFEMAFDALQERKAGKWVKDEYGTDHCSCCDYIPAYDTAIDDIYYSPYCPNCGAKMEGDE